MGGYFVFKVCGTISCGACDGINVWVGGKVDGGIISGVVDRVTRGVGGGVWGYANRYNQQL